MYEKLPLREVDIWLYNSVLGFNKLGMDMSNIARNQSKTDTRTDELGVSIGVGWLLRLQGCLELKIRSQSSKTRQQQTLPVEPIVEQNVVPMADNRTMAQMLQAPIEGYEDAIVVPPINANNFELKQPLINLVQSNKFT
ncbi:hypothetical protein Tco_0378463 [Tanacetum coccineum]